jgi:hypothetical protein
MTTHTPTAAPITYCMRTCMVPVTDVLASVRVALSASYSRHALKGHRLVSWTILPSYDSCSRLTRSRVESRIHNQNGWIGLAYTHGPVIRGHDDGISWRRRRMTLYSTRSRTGNYIVRDRVQDADPLRCQPCNTPDVLSLTIELQLAFSNSKSEAGMSENPCRKFAKKR